MIGAFAMGTSFDLVYLISRTLEISERDLIGDLLVISSFVREIIIKRIINTRAEVHEDTVMTGHPYPSGFGNSLSIFFGQLTLLEWERFFLLCNLSYRCITVLGCDIEYVVDA